MLMAVTRTAVSHVLEAVMQLPSTWHGAGCCGPTVLEALVRHAEPRGLRRSVETGTGKTTLLLSHLSERHTVFTKEDVGDGDSLAAVQKSPLLRQAAVEFVLGPTQRTLAQYRFTEPLDLVLLDGPHAYPFPQLEYYYLYPHLADNGLLIVDDIHIPTIFQLFSFLADDSMFDLLSVVGTTAFFRRTAAPLFDPLQDGWEHQRYNQRRFPILAPLRADIREPWPRGLRRLAGRLALQTSLGGRVPRPAKVLVKRIFGWSG